MIKIKLRKLIRMVTISLLSVNLICTNVQALNINFKDYSFEKSIENQTMCSSGYIDDEYIGYTESLYFYDENIWSLEGIQNFYNLKNLELSNTNVNDLSPISNLTNMKSLSINNSAVNNLTEIRNLTNLQTLTCTNLNLENYSAIGQLTNLESLTLDNCNISDLSFLKNLKHLKHLSLRDNYIKDISELKTLNNLAYIDLTNNFISDISSLVTDSKDSSKDAETKDVNYRIDKNKLIIDSNDLFKNDDMNIITILDESFNIEMLFLQKDSFLKGDSNNDGIVNLEDLTEAAKDYNKTSKDSNTWNIHEDTNKDGIIDKSLVSLIT